MRVLIVGGAGAFGSFYAKLLAKNGFEVCVYDKDAAAGKAFCQQNGFQWLEKKPGFKKADIAIVSVPNDVAPSVVREASKLLSKDALLFDFCSVKTAIVKELKKLLPLGLQLASIHPMHGPRVQSIAGYPVICIPIKPGEKLDAVKAFFVKNGAEFFFSTAEEHDGLLSIVQGLTHYSQFISASVLKEMNVDLKGSAKFGSPNYRLFLSLISRVVLQNPELYAQMQLSNPANKRVWAAFKKEALEFDLICRKGDLQALKKKIIDSAQLFKGEDSFLWESDRAVNAINYFIESILHHIGKRFLVQNMLTGKFHYGIIEGLAEHEIIMGEHGKKTRISLQKARLTSKKEMQEWKRQNLKQLHLDYSFLVPKECENDVIRFCLSQIKECSFELLGEYSSDKLPNGKKSLTFRANFFEEDGPAQIDQKIRNMIKGLGFGLR